MQSLASTTDSKLTVHYNSFTENMHSQKRFHCLMNMNITKCSFPFHIEGGGGWTTITAQNN